jgi:hypothetical protein
MGTQCSSAGKHVETSPPYGDRMVETMLDDEELAMNARTLVLIDPSEPDGDVGITELQPCDDAVSLMVVMDARATRSLRNFAESEEIDISMAGLLYLDQVVMKVRWHASDVETISTSSSDAVTDIFQVLQRRQVNRVIVPASLPGLQHGGLSRLESLCPVPVVVAAATHSGEWQTASTLLPSGSRTNAP